MGIFDDMYDFCALKVEQRVLDRVTDNVLRVSRVAGAVTTVLDRLDGILIILENGLRDLAGVAKNAGTTVRLNPFANGPLKIVFRLVAAFLGAAEELFEGARLLVRNFRRVVHRRLRRRIDELLERIDRRIKSVVGIAGRIRVLVRRIEERAIFLDRQEDLLPDPIKAEIRNTFGRLYYDPVPTVEVRLRALSDSLDPIVREVEARLGAIEEAFDVMSGLGRAIAAIQSTVGAVLQRIADLGRAVKAFIDDNLAILGWFLDAIDYVIDKAFQLLGVDQVLDWIKRQLGNVPFVKEAREFIELVERAEQQIQDRLERLSAQLDGMAGDLAERASGTLDAHTGGTFRYIVRIAMQKLNIEQAIPNSALTALERARMFLERWEEMEAAGKEIREAAVVGEELAKLALQDEEAFFFREEALQLKGFVGERHRSFVMADGTDPLEYARSLREAAEVVLEILHPATGAAARFEEAYFDAAFRSLREDLDAGLLGKAAKGVPLEGLERHAGEVREDADAAGPAVTA